jgi:hypothetical protein
VFEVDMKTEPLAVEATATPEAGDGTCTCGKPGGRCVCGAEDESPPMDEEVSAYPYVYAIGRIEPPRFSSLAVEKEFVQLTGQTETAGLTDQQALHAVISERDERYQLKNRYLARQLCYVLSIEGLETYVLQPRDPADLDLLIEATRPAPSPMDVDVVIGVRGPIASPDLCNGLTLPIVGFDQIYSFDRESLIKAIPRPQGMTAKQFESSATDLFDGVLQMADNAGATDEHRAINYLAVRYPEIYARSAEQLGKDSALAGVEVRPSPLSGVRTIVEVIFSYTHRTTGFIEKFFVRVDVTEEFPFLVTKLSGYYGR